MSATATDATVPLNEAERTELARCRATCPFLGPAVAIGALPVRRSIEDPLASLDDLEALGNSGGGDLGEVLKFFGQGNHARMRGPSGRLDAPVPPGLFSLDLPGSQGSHPGHSGMLQDDPARIGSGRFDAEAFQRFIAPARDGLLTRTDVARFIASNLRRDPTSKVADLKVAALLATDLAALVGQAGVAAGAALRNDPDREQEIREVYERLTRLMGENNLMGSAGEFGLLFAFFEHRPDARRVGGEPTVPVADLTLMFRDLTFPDGWRDWPKFRIGWVANTAGLAVAAAHAYLAS